MVHKLTSIFTGGDVGNLNNAASRMRTAATEINKFKSMPKIDESIGNNIRNVSEGLKSLSDATKKMNDIKLG